jgi:hypothetical protein
MTNLIYNGDFEIITDYDADHWNTNGLVEYVNSPVYKGLYAAKLISVPYTESSIYQDNIPTINNRNYTLTFYATKLTSDPVYISVNINNSITLIQVLNTSYSSLSVSFTANTTLYSIMIGLNSGASVVIDDVMLVSSNFVTNGDFENSFTGWNTTGSVSLNTTIVQNGLYAAQINASSSLSQVNIPTLIKQNYVLYFWARRLTSSSTKFNIVFNEFTSTLSDTNIYTFYNIVFIPNGSSTSITFSTNSVNDVLIDNVWISRNLVLNGGFENFSGTTITSWTTSNGAIRTTTVVVSGSSAVSLPTLSSSVTQTNIQTIINRNYLMSFWGKLASIGTQNISVEINGVTTNIPLSTIYTNFTINFIPSSTTTTIKFTNPGSIGIFIDNVSITEVSLLMNYDFENITLNPNAPPWIKNGIVNYITNYVQNGTYAAALNSQASIEQTQINTTIGLLYVLYFWARTDTIPTTLLITINAIPFTYNISSTDYKLFKQIFTADSSNTNILFTNNSALEQSSIIYLDNISINSFTCFAGESLVLTKNILTDNISEVPVSEIKSNTHLVFSTKTNTFIPVIYNIITGPFHKFRLIKEGSLDVNKPSKDFYVTSGHVILVNGIETKARLVKSKKITTNPQLIYTICADVRQPILVNNLEVMAYGSDEWLSYSKKHNLLWNNNI